MTKEQKILLLFVLLIAGSGTALYVSKSGTSSTPAATETSSQTNQTTTLEATMPAVTANTGTSVSGAVTEGAVKTETVVKVTANKTITETLTYEAPGNNTNEITVTAVVDGAGNIVDVKFSYKTPNDQNSKQYLGSFDKAFSASTLIGAKIGSKQLSRVGGASLTTGAFNKALTALATKVTG